MKTILITGGAGFIGSSLCKTLVSEEKNHVICLDNFFTGKMSNISELFKYKNFELIRHDIIQPILLEVDEIYHLACPASPVHYQYNPVKTIKTNVMGTINMLGLAKRVNAKILLASTSEIYGNPLEHPQKEEYYGNVNCIGPRSCYDEGKRVAETLMNDYHTQNNVDIRIARIFNTYGMNMSAEDGRVVSNFIVNALKNNPLEIYGDGSQTRSFCHVSDMHKGLIKLMNSEITSPVNLGNPHEITIKEIAQTVIELCDSKSQIIYKALPQDDPLKRKPDITKAKTLLNWEPEIDLKRGLTSTIKYFQDLIRGE